MSRKPLALAAALIAVALLAPSAHAAPALATTFDVSGMPGRITVGNDGTVWFTIQGSSDSKEFGRITPGGVEQEFDSPTNLSITGLTTGPDGNIWGVESGFILKIPPADPTTATEFSDGDLTANSGDITTGPDGHLWTGAGAHVVEIDPAHPGASGGGTDEDHLGILNGTDPRGIAAGGDGNLWIIDNNVGSPDDSAIVRFDTAGNVIGTPTKPGQTLAQAQIVAGPTGQLAFTQSNSTPQRIGRIDYSGHIDFTDMPGGIGDPTGIVFGNDGAYWTANFGFDSLGRLTPGGDFTQPIHFDTGSGPRRIATGPNDTLWVSLEQGKKIAKVTGVSAPPGGGTNPPPPPIARPAVSSLALSRTTFAQGSKLATISKTRRAQGRHDDQLQREPPVVDHILVREEDEGLQVGQALRRPQAEAPSEGEALHALCEERQPAGVLHRGRHAQGALRGQAQPQEAAQARPLPPDGCVEQQCRQVQGEDGELQAAEEVMARKPLALAAATLALGLTAPAVRAAIVPGQVIDGPSNAVQRFGDVDMAPDGTGALAYVKKLGTPSKEHIFVSRFVGGAWTPPEQVSTAADCPCSVPHVAVGNGGRVVVVFSDLNQVPQAALKPDGASPFQLTSPDAGTGGGSQIQNEDVDMDPVSGVAYAIEDVGVNQHVAAARLVGTTWSTIDTGDPNHYLDHDPGNAGAGGTGNQEAARIAVDSAGNAVAVWPELDALAKGHVYVRRITGTTAASSSIDAAIPALAGHSADGLNVNMVNIDGGGSPNPWVVFREQFTYTGGLVRALARQLVGDSLSPAQVLDGLPLDNPDEGAEFPRIDVNPAGQGLAASPRQLHFAAEASALSAGTWSPGMRLDTGTPTGTPLPVPALADSGNGLVAWIDTSGATSKILAREYVGGIFGAPITLSVDSAGGVLGGDLEASSSAAGTTAIGFGQNNGTGSSIVAAVVDLPIPPPPSTPSTPVAKPALSSLKLSRTTFAQGSKLATISRKKRRHKVGTTISFNVSEQSSTKFSFARRTKGFRSGKRCVARRPKRHRKAKRCTRYVKSGSLPAFSTAAGTHRVHFEGRLSRKKRLKPGRYRLTVVSSNSAGRSKAKTTSFRLLRR